MDKLLQEINDQFRKDTMLPVVTLKIEPAETTVFNSKFGGTPYLPEGFSYPKNPHGTPLRLLAQLNLSELPKVPDFPEEGILQFYIDGTDDVMGLDFDDQRSQAGFRVVYHETVIADESKLAAPPALEETEDSYFPFSGEFKVTGKAGTMPLPTEDYRFHNKYQALYNKVKHTNLERVWDLDEANDICEEFSFTGHRMGGYPFFTQNDPREYEDALNAYTIMLFQMDSDHGINGNNWDILWGDCGVANFFITPEQLKNRDFSKVLYNWDCC